MLISTAYSYLDKQRSIYDKYDIHAHFYICQRQKMSHDFSSKSRKKREKPKVGGEKNF
jgi:hypothetical protein